MKNNKNKKLKVAIDSSPLTGGHSVRGIGVQVRELINHLGKLDSDFEINPVDFDKTKLEKYDILHFTQFHPYFISLPKNNYNAKTIATIDDLIPVIYPDNYPAGIRGKINLMKNKNRLKNIDAVITISQTSKKDISKYLNFPRERIYVTHLAAHDKFKSINNKTLLNQVKAKFGLPNKFVLYVGDVNFNKNLGTLIKASHKLKVPLVIVGKHAKDLVENPVFKYSIEGPLDYLRFAFDKPHPELVHISDLKKILLENKVILPGYVNDNELVTIYNLASVYCQPSYYEGFGLPLLEAMKCGVPIVASNIEVHKEIAGEAVVYADPKNIENIATQIQEVVKDKGLREKLVKKGFEKAKEYSWQKTAEDTLKIYEKVLGF